MALALGLSLTFAGAARAADAKNGAAPTAADFARLEREVADQRQLIIQMLTIEQERYNFLLKLLQSGGQAPSGAAIPTTPMPPVGGEPTAGESEPSAVKEKEAAYGVVTGRVQARSGALKDTYVYLDQLRGGSARGKTLEITQKDKQFWPRVAVVQRGTSVVFPNLDAIYHNVFSTSGRNAFDLGAYRAGETPRSVVLSAPGVVEIFCNIHSRMSAAILVVPSPVYAKVGADGSFRLENVPVGTRRLTVWAPGMKPAQQKVEVTAAGAQANFTVDEQPATAHLNKLGQPYGSYKE
ncbi:MAG TPA: carboxypeptidase regulatory-like domain-containing protein [Polyangia bacterium]|nr:carboxypeptidase regulatory-like domain-containing protein [Polyangia bacterium]